MSWSGLAPQFTWRPSQRHLLDLAAHVTDRLWHLCAPPGAGRTLVGLELARQVDRPALVLGPTTAIRDQWQAELDRALDDVVAGEQCITWAVRQVSTPTQDDALAIATGALDVGDPGAWLAFWDRDPLVAASVCRWWGHRGLSLPSGFTPPADGGGAFALADRLVLLDAWLHDPDGGYVATISGVQDDAATVWADSLAEAIGPLGQPRWMVAAPGGAWRVPAVVGATRQAAEAFAARFRARIPGTHLVRTGTPEATTLVLAAARERPAVLERTLRWR